MTKTTNRTTLTYAYNDQNHRHAVTSITINGIPHAFTYDGNGNMQSGPDLTDMNSIADRSSITYNADNMPKTIVHGTEGTVNLIYDGEGTRAKKTGNNSTTYYIGEHYEITDTGSTKYIFAGNLRLAKISQEGILYFHKDHLNSSTVMSNETGIGSVETTEYMPFGSMRDHSGTSITNYKFTDQELDPETGLYNYRARLYDPSIGRFITPDSIIPDPYDPQSLNRYSYCRNNPLIYVDPSGHMDVDVDTGDNYGGFGGLGIGNPGSYGGEYSDSHSTDSDIGGAGFFGDYGINYYEDFTVNVEAGLAGVIADDITHAIAGMLHDLVFGEDLHKGLKFGLNASGVVIAEAIKIVAKDIVKSVATVPFQPAASLALGKSVSAVSVTIDVTTGEYADMAERVAKEIEQIRYDVYGE